MTMVPFIVPSRGRVKIFPAGRLVSIRGRLQIPLSSSFHSRQFTSKVTFVPVSDLTLMIRFRRRRLLISPMFFLMMLKSADMPPLVNISKVIPGMVATREPSLMACRTALVWVREYRVGAMTTCCWRMRFATGVGGSSPWWRPLGMTTKSTLSERRLAASCNACPISVVVGSQMMRMFSPRRTSMQVSMTVRALLAIISATSTSPSSSSSVTGSGMVMPDSSPSPSASFMMSSMSWSTTSSSSPSEPFRRNGRTMLPVSLKCS